MNRLYLIMLVTKSRSYGEFYEERKIFIMLIGCIQLISILIGAIRTKDGSVLWIWACQRSIFAVPVSSWFAIKYVMENSRFDSCYAYSTIYYFKWQYVWMQKTLTNINIIKYINLLLAAVNDLLRILLSSYLFELNNCRFENFHRTGCRIFYQ